MHALKNIWLFSLNVNIEEILSTMHARPVKSQKWVDKRLRAELGNTLGNDTDSCRTIPNMHTYKSGDTEHFLSVPLAKS